MLQVILFILSVTLATVNGWGGCTAGRWDYSAGDNVSCSYGANCPSSETKCQDVACNTYSSCPKRVETFMGTFYNPSKSQQDFCQSNTNYCESTRTKRINCTYTLICSSERDADSTICVQNGGTWDGDSCVTCSQADTTFTEISCAYDAAKGKYLNLSNKIIIVDCEVTVVEHQYYSNTCDSNCTVNSDLTCLGSVDGVNVYLRSCNGKVTTCEADGSCAFAMQKVANGECENPNDPTATSGSSSSEQGSSSSGGGNAADSLGWLKDSLHVIHITDSIGFAEVNNNLENIQPFVAGTYDQVTDIAGTVHDINSNLLTGFEFLNDIKENTGNTATNTGNINNKLNTTNSLLEDIKNKNWHTTVNVSPPEVTVQGDTNIINVSGDTAKSGFEILNYLKRIFGSDTSNNYNPNDTAGTGAQERSLLDKIDSALTDTMPVMNGDSVQAMGDRMRGSYRAIMDSIGNSAINDSMNRWSEAITDNGVITGNGSDNCPDILTQTFDVNFPIGGTVSIGPLGVYLCRPVAGLSITFWALCRVILRAMVAIFAMIWLYKSVLGIDGGSDDED